MTYLAALLIPGAVCIAFVLLPAVVGGLFAEIRKTLTGWTEE